MNSPKIMVLGLGNILLSDEGLGVKILDYLTHLPENVELVKGETAGIDLVYQFNTIDFLIIIDAVNAHSTPGSIFKLKASEFLLPPKVEFSFHQVGLSEVLSLAQINNNKPQILIYGVQPKVINWGLELSPEVQSIFPKIIQYIEKEIDHIYATGRLTE